jgi:hypothetical protein
LKIAEKGEVFGKAACRKNGPIYEILYERMSKTIDIINFWKRTSE